MSIIAIEAEQTEAEEPAGSIASRVLEPLSAGEAALAAIMLDPSGLDQAEFLLVDNSKPDLCYRAKPFQFHWWRCRDARQMNQCSRDVGKSESLMLRCLAFPFIFPGEEMTIFTPEFTHINRIAERIETRIVTSWFYRALTRPGRSGITHRPFCIFFANGSRIISSLPQRSGIGAKGAHSVVVEIDEAQDLSPQAWKEIPNTISWEKPGARWYIHGVSRGVRDDFFEYSTKPELGFTVHRLTQMHRADWTEERRRQLIEEFGGSVDSPDYKRNVKGEHGDTANVIFILANLMAGTDTDECFPAGTPVDTPHGPRPIESIRAGDVVLNAAGTGVVRASASRLKGQLCRITCGDTIFVCSTNHPFFTARGWVHAHDLASGDRLIARSEAVRLVWDDLHAAAPAEHDVFEGVRGGLAQKSSASGNMRALRRRLPAVEQGEPVLLTPLHAQVAGLTDPCAGSPASPSPQAGGAVTRSCVRVVHSAVHAEDGPSTILRALLLLEMESNSAELALRYGRGRATAKRSFSDGEGGPDGCRAVANACCLDQRPHHTSAHPVEAAGPSLVARTLRGAHGSPRWSRMDVAGSGVAVAPGGRRGGRGISQPAEGVRRGEGRGAEGRRVDRVEVLERGDPEFDRLSGGDDLVELFDLDVAGHPSFSVHGTLVHNSSHYNQTEYTHFDMRGPEIQSRVEAMGIRSQESTIEESSEHHALAMQQFLDFPALHTERYKVFWAGMDVGLVDDPSEILIFAEYHPEAAERRANKAAKLAVPLDGMSRLKLINRISMRWIPAPLQADTIMWVIEEYPGLRAFSMDSTGNGLPVFQELQKRAGASRMKVMDFADVEHIPLAATDARNRRQAQAKSALTTIKGYNFSGKVIVGFDEEKMANMKAGATPQEVADECGSKQWVKDAATDMLRGIVDTQRHLLPYDREVLRQWNAQTWSYGQGAVDKYGRRKTYSSVNVHTLDAGRMMIIGHDLEPIEEFLREPPKRARPVLDYFVEG